MYKLNLILEHNTKNLLGEGLFVHEQKSYWVDIDSNKIYCDGVLLIDKLDVKPSVIFSSKSKNLTFGCDRGIYQLNLISKKYKQLHASPLGLYSTHRSNDGCFFNKGYFLGFMHRSSPEENEGYIYFLNKSKIQLIDKTIQIPNGFIPLDDKSILICDSFSGKIWKFSFFEEKIKKNLWTDIGSDLSPDGGCLVGENVFISMWGRSAIFVFDLNGKLIQEIKLNIKFPTNCKYSQSTNLLYLTSANLESSLSDSSEGNSFVYELIYSPNDLNNY